VIDKLLEVKNLRVELQTKDGIVPVIDDLSFDLDYGESLVSLENPAVVNQ
jgi:ABC-type dipeptide/oligopeptide/nickel transport system ATPase component